MISASAPAGIANRNSGRAFAAWTSDTIRGLASRPVINQLEAALYIQPPTLETTVASHNVAKMRCRNGAQGDALTFNESGMSALSNKA
jgi:hypothetical protein